VSPFDAKEPDFLGRHLAFSADGCFVVGNRILLSPGLTDETEAGRVDPLSFSAAEWVGARLRGDVNRLLPLVRLPDGAWRLRRGGRWQGARTCNLALWRKDFLAVNGFDESYRGWGHEDADLVVRLLRHGLLRKDGHFGVPVLHLWHRESARDEEPQNIARLREVLAGGRPLSTARGANYRLMERKTSKKGALAVEPHQSFAAYADNDH